MIFLLVEVGIEISQEIKNSWKAKSRQRRKPALISIIQSHGTHQAMETWPLYSACARETKRGTELGLQFRNIFLPLCHQRTHEFSEKDIL